MFLFKKRIKDKKDICTIINIPDDLWDDIRILWPNEKPSKTIGRPIIPYIKVRDEILYILRTGCRWNMLLKDYGTGQHVAWDSKNGRLY